MARSAFAVGVALLLSAGSAAPAAAQPTVAVAGGEPPVYLALGDSVAAGVGAEPFVTGYPEQVGALLAGDYNAAADRTTPNAPGDMDVVNYAVSGATTSTLIADQLPKSLQLIEERRNDGDPLNDVEAVTVTIGGNDVFRPVVNACVLGSDPTGCQSAVDGALAAIGADLTTILTDLTTAAGPATEVVITTYYNPIGSCVLTSMNPKAPAIADAVLEGGAYGDLFAVGNGLNDVIEQAAAESGAQVADVYGQLDADQYVGGSDCLHPNLSGHTTIAEVVYETFAH